MAGFGQVPPFSNDEKNFILAEVIKTNGPHYNVLLNVVNQNNYQPKWEDMLLPPGRSIAACRQALDEVRRGSSMYSPLSQAGGPGPMSATTMPKRSLTLESAYAGGRTILPKTATYYPPSIAEPPAKRKRGRPTKAEQQARAAEQVGESSAMGAASGPRVQTPQSASMPTSPAVFPRASSQQALPPVSRMLVSAVMTPTAPAPAPSTSHSGSSSGKRRRRRRSDEQAMEDESGGSYVSQYGRPLDDTPARSSASRRRSEEPIHSSVARLGVSEVEQAPGAPSSASPGPFGGPP